MTQIVDGLGQIGSVIYSSIASLPAPHLGHFCFVDDGTTGTLYVGVSLSGVASWLPIYSVPPGSFVKTNPGVGENVINDSHAGDVALTINGELALIARATDEYAAILEQTASAPVNAILSLERSHATPAQPIGQAIDDGSTITVFVNGYGEITVRAYSPNLPAANTNHLGAIARLVAGGSGTDTFWYCGLVGGTPTWSSLQGPPGATGATPLFNSPSVTGLSYGSAPTLVQSGDGSVATPYHQTFGIPAGAPGATGPAGGFATPPLPNPGDPPLIIWVYTEAIQGTFLPWRIPLGYLVEAIGGWGLWQAYNISPPIFISDWKGTVLAGGISPTGHDSAEPVGAVICGLYNTSGDLIANGASDWWYPLTGIIMPQDGMVIGAMNLASVTAQGYILVEYRITAAGGAGVENLFFSADNYGFSGLNPGDPVNNVWTAGQGWQGYRNPAHLEQFNDHFWGVQSNTATITAVKIYWSNSDSTTYNSILKVGTTDDNSAYFGWEDFNTFTAHSSGVWTVPGISGNNWPAGAVWTIYDGAGLPGTTVTISRVEIHYSTALQPF